MLHRLLFLVFSFLSGSLSWSCHQFSRRDKTVLELKHFQSWLSSNNLANLALLRHICRKTDKSHNFAKHFKATGLFSTLCLFSYFCLTLRLSDWCRKSSLGNGFISSKGARTSQCLTNTFCNLRQIFLTVGYKYISQLRQIYFAI